MTMWLIIMWTALGLTGAALVYLSNRVCQFGHIKKITRDNEKLKALIGGGIVFGLFGLISLWLNFINAIVCAVYFAMIWLICDFIFWLWQKSRKQHFQRYYAGVSALICSFAALTTGWYLDHHVWQTTYTLSTTKNVQPLKIILFADSHIGTTFNAKGFAEHAQKIQAQNPDVIIVAGDFVDDDSSRADMLETSRILGNIKTKYGVYFVFGNHDSGYYGAEHRGFSAAELIVELEKNGVKVLRDETVLIADTFYIIGRRDRSVERERRGNRLSMYELIQPLDQNKYMITVDHQPADYKNQAEVGVDLVLSGHTHGGQLFPFNQVGKWIGANDHIYGLEQRGKTDFIVTSGISDWAIKFKTGTKSEYVVINIQPE